MVQTPPSSQQPGTPQVTWEALFPYGKLYFYEQILQVPTDVTYDPYALQWEVRRLQAGAYQVQSPAVGDRV